MKLNKNRKAQAALEFLSTYGWAMMVVMVMVAALAYFGVLNPSKYLPDRCSFGVQLHCEDYVIRISPVENEGYVEFVLLNAMGSKVTIDSSEIEVSGVIISCETFSDEEYFSSQTEFDDQTMIFFKCYGDEVPDFVIEEKVKVKATVKYIKEIYSKPIYGDIYGTPQ